MNKIILFLISACLCAEERAHLGSALIEDAEKTVQAVEEVEEGGLDKLETTIEEVVSDAAEFVKEAEEKIEAEVKEIASTVEEFVAENVNEAVEFAKEEEKVVAAEVEETVEEVGDEIRELIFAFDDESQMVEEDCVQQSEEMDEVDPTQILDSELQEVKYLVGDYLILDNGLLLTLEKKEYLELFDVQDGVSVSETENGYEIEHSLTQVKVPCECIGQVVGDALFVRRAIRGVLELSNGDLYQAGEEFENVLFARTIVLKVTTKDGDFLMDLASGSCDRVTSLGNVDLSKTLDSITFSKGHRISLESASQVRWISSALGNCTSWAEGDEVIVQRFTTVNSSVFPASGSLLLLYNVTNGELAVAFELSS